MLAATMIAVLSTGIIALRGMWHVTQQAAETGHSVGEQAAASSQAALMERMQTALQETAKDKAAWLDANLLQVQMAAQVLANQTTEIVSHPERYPYRQAAEPRRENGDVPTVQLYYSNKVKDRSVLRDEIGLTANVQDFLLYLYESNPMVISAYVGSKNGFFLVGDPYSDRGIQADGRPMTFQPDARPWYKQARQKNGLIFTDVILDDIGKELDITCAVPYQKNGEFAGVVGMDIGVMDTAIMTANHIADSGFAFIVNQRGHIIISPQLEGELVVDGDHPVDLRQSDNASLAAAVQSMVAGEEGVREVKIDGRDYYLAYAPMRITGWSFAAVVEMADVTAPAQQSYTDILDMVQKNMAVLHSDMQLYGLRVGLAIVVLVLLSVAASWRIAVRISQPISRLSERVREIARGDLDSKLDIHTGDEIESLAVSVNGMVSELKDYMKNLEKVTADRQHIATELSVAAGIQRSMMPFHFPAYPDRQEFEIYAAMHPAKEVGGDFYDFYLLDANHLVVTVADVSDKGVPAALFMVVAKTILKNFVLSMGKTDDLAAVMQYVNRQLCEDNEEMMFVTAFMGMLDIRTGEFTYINAGHNPPLVRYPQQGGFQYISVERNRVLGISEDFCFVQQKLQLIPETMLFFYTDGVTEAMDPEGRPFLSKRLQLALDQTVAQEDCEHVLQRVQQSVEDYVRGAPQSDDMTMMGLCYHGSMGRLDDRGKDVVK